MDNTQATPQPQLRRSTHDRVIFGVCGGLGAYFGIDPVVVRLIFVLATLAGGAGIPLYVILAIVIPSETEENPIAPAPPSDTAALRRHSAEIAGAFLAVIGMYLLAQNMGWVPWLNANVIWPLALVALGVYLIAARELRHSA